MLRDEKGRFISPREVPKYEITVWNHIGDIVVKLWEATEREADEICDQYEDDGNYMVQVEDL